VTDPTDYIPNPYFGEPWDSPFCDTAPRTGTPVGERCGFCTDPIQDGDRGIITPAILAGGQPGAVPWHHECWMRQVAGSPFHLRGQCSCHGGENFDARNATERRAEAGASYDLIRQMGGSVPDGG